MKSFIAVLQKLMVLAGSRTKQLWLSVAFSVVEAVLGIVPLIALFFLLDETLASNLEGRDANQQLLVLALASILVSILLGIVVNYTIKRLRSAAAYQVLCEKRRELGTELKYVSMGYLDVRNLGDLTTAITSDAGFIELYGMEGIHRVATGLSSLIVGLGLLFFLDWRLVLCVCVVMLPVLLAFRYVYIFVDKIGLNRQEEIATVTEATIEFIKGLQILKAYNLIDRQFYKTRDSYAKLSKIMLKGELAYSFRALIYRLCFHLLSISLIATTTALLLFDQISFSAAIISIVAAFILFNPLEAAGEWLPFVRLTGQSLDRMDQIKDMPKMTESRDVVPITESGIVFHKVGFAYEQTAEQVLKEVDFTVPERSTCALVGPSGSGKTTIVNLIARFWDVLSGSILVGGVDVRNASYDDLLKQLSFVFQEVYLFDDTIMNNIRFGRPDASEEEVVAAAKRACCHEFITALPSGYQTFVGEGGARLSGGEKQRVSIARALIKDAPIVLLDEMTAHIDAQHEHEIQRALQELLRNRTVVMIAHKLSTVRHADQIIVLDNGCIVEQGHHENLMSQNGLYRRLWDRQFQTSNWRF